MAIYPLSDSGLFTESIRILQAFLVVAKHNAAHQALAESSYSIMIAPFLYGIGTRPGQGPQGPLGALQRDPANRLRVGQWRKRVSDAFNSIPSHRKTLRMRLY